jgi:perosamine synthetase
VNLLAAMGVAQMEQLPGFLRRKKEIYNMYTGSLKHIAGFSEQKITPGVDPNLWLQTFTFNRSGELMKYLTERKIQVRPFWVPMNRLDMFKSEVYVSNGDTSGKVYGNCVSLPCSTNITNGQVQEVIDAIIAFYK